MPAANLISEAISIVGLSRLARECNVTYQAIRKWERQGFLPRTEWTGETSYAAVIAAATGGAVSQEALLAVLLSRKLATEKAAA